MEVDGEIASYLDFPATDSDQEPLGWWKRDFHKLPRNVTGFMKTDHFAKNTKIELFISEDSSIYGEYSKCGSVAIAHSVAKI